MIIILIQVKVFISAIVSMLCIVALQKISIGGCFPEVHAFINVFKSSEVFMVMVGVFLKLPNNDTYQHFLRCHKQWFMDNNN